MIGKDIILEVKDKCSSDKGSESFINQLLRLPEEEFCRLVSIRLNVPLSEANQKEFGAEDREYWS